MSDRLEDWLLHEGSPLASNPAIPLTGRSAIYVLFKSTLSNCSYVVVWRVQRRGGELFARLRSGFISVAIVILNPSIGLP
jgi:hypothetical protein